MKRTEPIPGTGIDDSYTPTPRRTIPIPDGCRWCGVGSRGHMQRWKPSVGWHKWTPPTDAQRLARMTARRTQRKRTTSTQASEETPA